MALPIAKHLIWKSARLGRIEALMVMGVRRYKNMDPDKWDPVKQTFKRDLASDRFEKEKFPGEYDEEYPKGKIYDKKPFKWTAEGGKTYAWCSCGHSRNQPFCDGRHRKLDGTAYVKRVPKYRPIRFQVDETKDVWLCNCKQSNNRPYCDGTHKREDIQTAIR